MQVKQLQVKINNIIKVRPDIFLLSIKSPYLARNTYPGQFVHLKIDSVILRRPFSIHNLEGDNLYILFRVRGRGTKVLSRYKTGKVLDLIGPLGQGFKIRDELLFEQNILLAGGMGVAPLLFLANRLSKAQGASNIVLLGAKTRKEVLCERDFRKLGFRVYVSTEDGSKGLKGAVTGLLKKILSSPQPQQMPTNIYACGPKEMFFEINKALKGQPGINCQISFEQFMGCGLGICCGCAIETKKGYKKVCKDGPVFDMREVW